ncbi:hypothetical protein NDNC_0160 [Candidatus Nasuia deltocephalinicola]|nr:hypothetical protein NDNC_0160 [Candidatus Nasuia deltocephalinicola]
MKTIIIGGGHSGLEASNIIAKMGGLVLLITKNINNIGEISCNPSMGGLGKSHLVREIDSLGGLIGYISTKSSIQLKKINVSKGESVYCTRSQISRNKYKDISNKIIKNKNISIVQDEVEKLIIKNNKVIGVKTKLNIYKSNSVIVTTGTFLRSKIYIGLNSWNYGRFGEKNSTKLSKQLNILIGKSKSLKTGTSPRISKKNIDFKNLKIQKGDFNPIPSLSSWYNLKKINNFKDCWISKTTLKTKEIIIKNLEKSPIYKNLIDGTSPRYCPSIEDKIYKFYKKKTHNIFLEPDENEFYLNGISTSLPFEEQIKLIRSINGLENTIIKKLGYTVEYDFFNPKNLKKSLETKNIKGLFLAGQINGTTGYEEAAAQGIIAGINSFLYNSGKKYWYPNKKNSYIGIMINDIINFGITEPYRIFTNKNKNKFEIREENSDERLKILSKNLKIKYKNKLLIFKKIIKKKIKNLFLNNILFFKNIKFQIKIYFKYKNYLKVQIVEKIKKIEIFKNINKIFLKKINYFKISNLSKETSEILNKKKYKSLFEIIKSNTINFKELIIITKYLKNLN